MKMHGCHLFIIISSVEFIQFCFAFVVQYACCVNHRYVLKLLKLPKTVCTYSVCDHQKWNDKFQLTDISLNRVSFGHRLSSSNSMTLDELRRSTLVPHWILRLRQLKMYATKIKTIILENGLIASENKIIFTQLMWYPQHGRNCK